MAFQSRKQNNRDSPPREMTANERISFEEAFKKFVDDLSVYKTQVEAVLPSGISFARFRSVIIMAIRRTPKLVECERTSLINACIYAAHDGLLPDGRDAVILPVYNTLNKCWEASYRSMVAGLIRQIISSGAATKIQPFVVYRGEEFEIFGGSDARIHHRIEPDGQRRGDPIGIYAVAGLKVGDSTFQYMTVEQIEEVRKIAQTQKVWEKHWEEMGIKTVIRRLRKRLAGQSEIQDIEERLMFPQYAAAPAPALGAPTPRPTRDQFERLEDRSGDNGVPLSWGDDREPVRDERRGAVEQSPARQEQTRERDQDDGNEIDWAAWSRSLHDQISRLETIDAVNACRAHEHDRLQSAPAALGRTINSAFQDRLVELTAGSSSRDAGARGDGDAAPAGDSE